MRSAVKTRPAGSDVSHGRGDVVGGERLAVPLEEGEGEQRGS